MSKFINVLLGILYWIAQLTWGILTTFVGFFVIMFVIIFLKGKPHRNGYSMIVEVGGNWGGVELGAFALCGRYSQKDGPCYNPQWFQHTRKHEFGHSIQNIIFGPLTIFIVGIPSMCRYWYQRIMQEKYNKIFPSDWYDGAWFEGTATKWGSAIVDKIEK